MGNALKVVERDIVIAFPSNPSTTVNETSKGSTGETSNGSSETPDKSIMSPEFGKSSKRLQGYDSKVFFFFWNNYHGDWEISDLQYLNSAVLMIRLSNIYSLPTSLLDSSWLGDARPRMRLRSVHLATSSFSTRWC